MRNTKLEPKLMVLKRARIKGYKIGLLLNQSGLKAWFKFHEYKV
jgi:hypothetical protein